ncbi:MAG: glycosyltransferase family 4 protein [Pseudomonadota bacterium]
MNDRPLSIAYFVPSWPPGAFKPNGIIPVVEQMRQLMRARGHRVHIITATSPDDFVEDDFQRCDVSRPLAHRVLSKIGLGQMIDDRATHVAKAIARSINDIGNVDVFEIEESFGLCGRVAAVLGRPGVCRLHGPWYQSLRTEGIPLDAEPGATRVRDETTWFRTCEHVTAPTQFVLDDMIAFTGHKPAHHQAIFNPALDHGMRLEQTAEVRNRILFVGRIDLRKGADLAFAAFGRIAEDFPDAQLTVAGPDNGVERDGEVLKTKDLIERFVPASAHDRVDYKGVLKPNEVTSLRQNHGITLVPSRYENQPSVVSEAMMAESAVVCTRTPYTEEIFQNERNGLDFELENVDDLARALARLLRDPDEQARIGANAGPLIRGLLSPAKIAEETEAFYWDVVRSSGKLAAQ